MFEAAPPLPPEIVFREGKGDTASGLLVGAGTSRGPYSAFSAAAHPSWENLIPYTLPPSQSALRKRLPKKSNRDSAYAEIDKLAGEPCRFAGAMPEACEN